MTNARQRSCVRSCTSTSRRLNPWGPPTSPTRPVSASAPPRCATRCRSSNRRATSSSRTRRPVRIPTDKGYRFFVDHMAEPGRLDTSATQRVGAFFDATHGRLEEMLHQTSNLLSQLTHHASLVVGPPADRATIRSIQVVSLSARIAVVVAVLSSGSVENQTIELDGEVHRAACVGGHRPPPAGVARARARSGRPRPSGDPEVDTICAAAQKALLVAGHREPVFVGGTSVVAQSFRGGRGPFAACCTRSSSSTSWSPSCAMS